MFKLLRYFSIVSLVALVFTTITLIILNRHMAINQLTELTKHQNAALVQTFADHVGTDSRSFDTINGEFDKLTDGLSIIELDVYDQNGITLFSTRQGRIGTDQSRQRGFITASRKARLNSEFSIDYRASGDNDAEPTARDVIETFVPVLTGDQKVHAVFHLYSDVTQQMMQIDEFQTKLTKVLLLSFILLYGVLFLIVRHADQILHRQYQNLLHNEQKIRRTHRQLEQEATQRAQIEQVLLQVQETHEHNGNPLTAKPLIYPSV